jgi:hypothetical protein
LEHAGILADAGQGDAARALLTDVIPELDRMEMTWFRDRAARIMTALDAS